MDLVLVVLNVVDVLLYFDNINLIVIFDLVYEEKFNH